MAFYWRANADPKLINAEKELRICSVLCLFLSMCPVCFWRIRDSGRCWTVTEAERSMVRLFAYGKMCCVLVDFPPKFSYKVRLSRCCHV